MKNIKVANRFKKGPGYIKTGPFLFPMNIATGITQVKIPSKCIVYVIKIKLMHRVKVTHKVGLRFFGNLCEKGDVYET